MRISSPPTSYSCFYGIATPERADLLASRYSVDEMAEFIGADSLAFVSIDGLYRAMGHSRRDPAAPRKGPNSRHKPRAISSATVSGQARSIVES